MRSFLKKEVVIEKEVSTEYEIARILSKHADKTVFFENVKGYDFKVVGNLCPSRERLCFALNTTKENFILTVLKALKSPLEPEIVGKHEFKEKKSSLDELPILRHFREDAGKYITSGVVIAKDKEHGRNASVHRLLVLSKNKLAIRLCERDLYRYYKKAEREGKPLEIAIAIGLHPAILFSAAFSYSIDFDELSLASSLMNKPLELVECETVEIEVPKESEIVIEGKILPEVREWEGPFLDITGTFDIKRKQPVIEVTNIMHRRNAIYHALLPAGEEHKLLMGMPQEPRIFEAVQRVTNVKNVCLTRGGCNWLHGVIAIRKISEGDGKNAIIAALAAHPSMKHVIIVDDDIDIFDINKVEYAVATRFQGDKDLVIIKGAKGSSLDPSSGKGNTTTKLGFDATRK